MVYPLITYCWCRWSRILIFGDFFYNRYDNFISLSELFSVAKERVKSGCAYKSEKSEIEFWRFVPAVVEIYLLGNVTVDVFKVLVKMVIIIFHISWFCITYYLHLWNERHLYVDGYWSLLWALLTNDNGQWGWAKEVKILCVVPQGNFIRWFWIFKDLDFENLVYPGCHGMSEKLSWGCCYSSSHIQVRVGCTTVISLLREF